MILCRESMNVGDLVTPKPSCGGQNWGTGEVVWVHPKGCFYTVEFRFGERKFRESYSYHESEDDFF